MPSARLAVFALIVVAGCSSGRRPAPLASAEPVASTSALPPTSLAPSASAAAPPSGATPALAPPFDASVATAVLVWQPTGKGAWKTVWIESGATGPEVRRERLEPVVATRRGLYALRVTTGDGSTVDAVALAGGDEKNLVEAHVEVCPANGGLEGAAVWITGAVGSIVFAGSHGFVFECEAPHPRFFDAQVAVDLDTGAPVAFDPFPGLARLQLFAEKKFKDEFGDEGGGCLTNPTQSPTLYSADFAYAGNGRLRGHYVFMKDANYMCGAGPGHYARTEEVHDSSLPPSMDGWKQAPRWLLPYLVKHPSVGVSPISPDVATAATAALFGSAPVPKPKPVTSP